MVCDCIGGVSKTPFRIREYRSYRQYNIEEVGDIECIMIPYIGNHFSRKLPIDTQK